MNSISYKQLISAKCMLQYYFANNNQYMSRTSLSQKNQQRQKQDTSILKRSQSGKKASYQEEYLQTHINITDEIQNFLHMKERYLKIERQHRFLDSQNEENLQCYSNIQDGYGINIFSNGDKYIGFWENSTMHGMGVYTFKSTQNQAEIIYLGQFLSGKFNGIGKLVKMTDHTNGEVIYIGNWNDGKKSENGVHFYDGQQMYYQGNWLNDQKSGEGKFVFPHGEYQGLWQNNERSGQGILRKVQNNITIVYEGLWENDELLFGDITYIDQNSNEQGKYRGQLLEGKKHGQGVYNWLNITYEGYFQRDQLKGNGTIKSNNFVLKGPLSEYNKKHIENVEAQISYLTNDKFEGQVCITDGKIIRKNGIYKFNIGDVAQGKFIDNSQGKIQGHYVYRWKTGEKKTY